MGDKDKSRFKLQLEIDKPVLLQIREALGEVRGRPRAVSQGDIAAEIGVSLNTIARWERGENQIPKMSLPQVKALSRLLKELGMTVDDLPDTFGPSGD